MIDRRAASLRARISVGAVACSTFLTLAACGSQPGPTRDVLPTTVATPPASAGAPGSTGPSTAPVSPPAGSPVAGDGVAVDPSLLSFIPITGNGLIQTIDPDTTAQVAQDPDLRANASALMIASYIPNPATASGAPGDDIAVVSVVRLRDPAADDEWFRSWRDSYDSAACANAGGVSRNSQTDIGTHTVFIAACTGGSFTYHTRLADGAIVVSITSVGSLRLGETIMGRLVP